MADHATTTQPARRTTGKAAATATNPQSARVTRTTHAATATATITATSAGSGALAAPTPTAAPEAAGGLSGAVLGGIGAGVVLLIAVVGLLFYKKRKRAAVAAAYAKKGGEKGGAPAISGAALSAHNMISGPMSLAPEEGIAAAPVHRPEAQFREQQQFRPGMRDELFASPGSTIQNNLSGKKEGPNTNGNNNSGNDIRGPPGAGSPAYVSHSQNEKDIYSGNNRQEPPSESFYDDHLVNDYYGGSEHAAPPDPGSVGAQRPAPQPKDLMHGNLTPAPEYYLGKEDIDPRRDLRGLDSPETYVRRSPSAPDTRQALPPRDSPRSSYSSDGGESAYLTLEQAQQAHNHKMMGHKQSIGSVDMLLIDHHSQSPPDRPNERSKNNGAAPPDHLLSVAISESTMSMMPSLPPTASPAPLNGIKHMNGSGGQYDPRIQQQQQQRSGPLPLRGQGPGPLSPRSQVARQDPYAESAYSEDYPDDRSLASGSYYNPHYASQNQGRQQQQQFQQHQPHSPGGRGGPYSPQPLSPSRAQHPPYPQQQGYNGNYNNSNNNNSSNRQYPGPPPPPHPNSRAAPPPPNSGYQRDGPYQRQF